MGREGEGREGEGGGGTNETMAIWLLGVYL